MCLKVKQLRKGREIMKKIIAIAAVLMLVGCMAVILTGCGGNDNNDMTSTTMTTTTTPVTPTTNSGMVTDESEADDNGVIGDIITDVSEDLSEMVTDVSEGMSDMTR